MNVVPLSSLESVNRAISNKIISLVNLEDLCHLDI